MRKILSYIVLTISAVVGLYSIYQINNVTSMLGAYNEDSANHANAMPDDVEPFSGAVEPEPVEEFATMYGEPTTSD